MAGSRPCMAFLLMSCVTPFLGLLSPLLCLLCSPLQMSPKQVSDAVEDGKSAAADVKKEAEREGDKQGTGYE